MRSGSAATWLRYRSICSGRSSAVNELHHLGRIVGGRVDPAYFRYHSPFSAKPEVPSPYSNTAGARPSGPRSGTAAVWGPGLAQGAQPQEFAARVLPATEALGPARESFPLARQSTHREQPARFHLTEYRLDRRFLGRDAQAGSPPWGRQQTARWAEARAAGARMTELFPRAARAPPGAVTLRLSRRVVVSPRWTRLAEHVGGHHRAIPGCVLLPAVVSDRVSPRGTPPRLLGQ